MAGCSRPETVAWLVAPDGAARAVGQFVATSRAGLGSALGSATAAPICRAALGARARDQGILVVQPAGRRARELARLARGRSRPRSRSRSRRRARRGPAPPQKSEARFRSLVAHSSDLITVLDGRRHRHLPESVDRAAPRLRPRATSRARVFDRLLAKSDRSRLAQLIAGRPASPTRHPSRTRSSARSGTETGRWLQFEVQHTNLLHDEHVRGHRPQQPRRQRAEGVRGPARPPGIPRSGHRPREPRALRRPRRARATRDRARRPADRRHVHRPRRLQDGQRQPRPRGRRHRAAGGRARGSRRRVRPTDTVARFGGDEFAVLLDGVFGSQEAAMIAERLLGALEAAVRDRRQGGLSRAPASASASLTRDVVSQDAEELLRNADVAMYMAKRDSKGGYRLFEPTMHERVVERLELRRELQRALEQRPARGLLPAGRPPRPAGRSSASRRSSAGSTRRAA